MSAHFTPIINSDELLKIKEDQNLILIDASNSPGAFENYQKHHLQGALFVDGNKQLATIEEDYAKGGRHPLPDLQKFTSVLDSLGIKKNSHVVIYDNVKGANSAARFWWMLKAIGHEKVQVLNGGFQKALADGFPTSSGNETPDKGTDYIISEWQLPKVDISEVEKATQDDQYTIIDVRENRRYLGETEPIDLIAGHIPSAINIPFQGNLDENGLFLSKEALHQKYSELLDKKNMSKVMIHCGSGVTACHSILAMYYAGLEVPHLYVGSWSEWSRNNKPMVTK